MTLQVPSNDDHKVIPFPRLGREVSAPAEIETAAEDLGGEAQRPTIALEQPLHLVVDEAIGVLAQESSVYQSHSEMVQVVREEGGRVRPRRLKNSQARYLLAKLANWTKEGEKTHPPESVAKCVLERTAWPRVRVLRAVTDFPALAQDGSLCTEPGYDDKTRTYFTGDVKVEVPDGPTQDDARDAVGVLRDIVQDFPFANEEHFAAFLAGMLTPLSRYAHEGNAPLILVQANGPRVGKTTLVKVISEIVTGTSCPVITFTNNEDETRKRILSFLRVARSMVLVDNVVGQFGGANINALTTSRSFEDRVLGQSIVIEAVNDTSWFVTGNNIVLSPDTAERCVNIRLQSDLEKPHLRTGFHYPHLFETIRERRGLLLSAALTILKAFMVAGKPDQGLPSWGGFEAWSRLVRGALVHAGLPDPAATRAELEDHSDEALDDSGNLIVGLFEWQEATGERQGAKAADILDHVRQHPDVSPPLRQALEVIAGVPGLPDAKTLSRHLREVRRRNIRGLVLMSERDRKSGHRWYVQRANETGAQGVQGAQDSRTPGAHLDNADH